MALNWVMLSHNKRSGPSALPMPIPLPGEKTFITVSNVDLSLDPILHQNGPPRRNNDSANANVIANGLQDSTNNGSIGDVGTMNANATASSHHQSTGLIEAANTFQRVAEQSFNAKSFFAKGGNVTITNLRVIYVSPLAKTKSSGDSLDGPNPTTSGSGSTSQPDADDNAPISPVSPTSRSRGFSTSSLFARGGGAGSEAQLETLTVPIENFQDGRFEQPWFGANYYLAEVVPVDDGGLPKETNYSAKLSFKSGMAWQFYETLEEIKNLHADMNPNSGSASATRVGARGAAPGIPLEPLPQYSPPASPMPPTNVTTSSASQSTQAQPSAPPEDLPPAFTTQPLPHPHPARRQTVPDFDALEAAQIAIRAEAEEEDREMERGMEELGEQNDEARSDEWSEEDSEEEVPGRRNDGSGARSGDLPPGYEP